MRKLLWLSAIFLLVTLLSPGFAYAQGPKTVTGTVLAEDGTPMPGVTVRIKGTNRNAQTDVTGKFRIEAKPGEGLDFSFIGFETQSVKVGENTAFNIRMRSSSSALEQVVVTAMGIKKEKKALGYAVQDIKSAELLKNKDANLVNSLNGKIAGLNITNSGGAPGSSAAIIIRGGTSLERDNQPLFVIDGMPMDNSTGQGDNSAFDGSVNLATTNGNRAMDINPEDIESISVLKGPAAAALYGLRAAAGAIIITTKKGTTGLVTGSVTSRYMNNWVNRLPKQQGVYKQGTYYKGTLNKQTSLSWGDKFQPGEEVFDNMGNFFQHANAFDNSFTVSGGTQNGNFFLSGSNLNQGGVVPTTNYNRSTLRFNGEQKIGIFTFGLNASYATSTTQKTLTGTGLWSSGGTGYMESIMAWPRNDDMRVWLNPDGTKHRLLPDIDLDADIDNPYWVINRMPQSDKTNRLIGSAYANVKLTSWLDATYRLGVDNYTTQFENLVTPGSSVKLAWQKGMLSQTDRNYNYVNSNLMLNFHKTFHKDWDANLILGTTSEDTYIKSNSARAENFLLPDFYALNNADRKNQYISQAVSRKRLAGFYGDLRLSYRNIFYLSVTGRNDISSTLPVQNRSFFYSSYSGSFVFTELLPKSDILSFGKIRASRAQVGKDASPYLTQTYLEAPQLTIGGGFRNGVSRGNPNLKPEKTTSSEFGAELQFLRGRLGLDVAYYKNVSTNQIVTPRVSNATGYILNSVNAGEIENKGIEISINANPVKKKDFNWNVTLNMSSNKGTVRQLPGSLSVLYVTDAQVANAKAASFDGGNFLGISGQKWLTDENGNVLLDWNTGLPTVSVSTTTYIGNREPKLLGGLNNNFTYKQFNFSFLWDFRVGGDVYNGTDYLLTMYGLSARTLNRGEDITLTGVAKNPATAKYEPVTKTVKATEAFYTDYYLKNAPFFIEKVNWLRLRSVSLSYALPKSALLRTPWLKEATITASGSNLLLFTNYSGMDPETSAAGAGSAGSGSSGIDYAGVPATSGFAIGLNLKF
ncbi:SusC/RagA family TonB-linked outer membrane protein [Chitinophaga sp. HK235]|uniref:SusC/RagA family TonB-linked outer membrane protein n=1 Tax=Chitinophaga sp. HK235 TaxID=2952571 RepID=UPI001BA4F324|nr:SusC/RagA family TonB-linked outer membrane protein [Chitinophaga sp. HK235]